MRSDFGSRVRFFCGVKGSLIPCSLGDEINDNALDLFLYRVNQFFQDFLSCNGNHGAGAKYGTHASLI
jgi:hypothetical protein